MKLPQARRGNSRPDCYRAPGQTPAGAGSRGRLSPYLARRAKHVLRSRSPMYFWSRCYRSMGPVRPLLNMPGGMVRHRISPKIRIPA